MRPLTSVVVNIVIVWSWYFVGKYRGRQEGRQEMAEYLMQEYPQLAYWQKLKSGG